MGPRARTVGKNSKLLAKLFSLMLAAFWTLCEGELPTFRGPPWDWKRAPYGSNGLLCLIRKLAQIN